MTCEECQMLALAGDDEAAREHLGQCPHCREELSKARAALERAALPPLTATERAQVHSLAATTLTAWKGGERRRSAWRKVAGLAAAAAVGGLIASAALWRSGAGVGPRRSPPAEAARDEAARDEAARDEAARDEAAPAAEDPGPADPELSPGDDELDAAAYEVPWTDDSDNPEGEAP